MATATSTSPFYLSLKTQRVVLVLLLLALACCAIHSYCNAVRHMEARAHQRAEHSALVAASLWDSHDLSKVHGTLVGGRDHALSLGEFPEVNGVSRSMVATAAAGSVQAWFLKGSSKHRALAFGFSERGSFGGLELPWTREALKSLRSGAVSATRPYSDQRDQWITAYAPLRGVNGNIVGALQYDYPIGAELHSVDGVFLSAWGLPLFLATLGVVLFLLIPRTRIPDASRWLATLPILQKPEVRRHPHWLPKLDVFYNQFLYQILLHSKSTNKRITPESFAGGTIVVDGTALKPLFKCLGSTLAFLIDKDIESDRERTHRGKRPSASIKFDAHTITDANDASEWLWLGVNTDGRGLDLTQYEIWEDLERTVNKAGGTVDVGCQDGRGTWITLLLPRFPVGYKAPPPLLTAF